jgi:hypothetical protein
LPLGLARCIAHAFNACSRAESRERRGARRARRDRKRFPVDACVFVATPRIVARGFDLTFGRSSRAKIA